MKVKYKKAIQITLGLVMMFSFVLVPAAQNVYAQEATNESELKCGVLPQFLCGAAKNNSGDVENTGVWMLLRMIVNIMTAGVAILATGGIIYGAILYTSAGPNQAQVAKAKQVILNVVIGIVAFALMFSLLQWLIPGGVF